MVSELEKQRLANIERNQRMLKEFQLQELSAAAFSSANQKPKPKTNGSAKSKPAKRKPKTEVSVPLRKSRRLEGIKVEETPNLEYIRAQEEKVKKEDERIRREGELKLEEMVGSGNWDQALEILESFGSAKVSMGDYFDSIPITDEKLVSIRDELGNLKPDSRDIKLVSERIFSIAFHPSTDSKMVIAGDKMGELGIWNSSQPDSDGVVSLKNHTRAVSTIIVDPQNPDRLYTSSYDGSIRRLDLPKSLSTEAFVFDSDPRDPVGVSDFALLDPHTMYYTTLDGQFGRVDTRLKKQGPPQVLHEKKIGGFAVNPMATHQIATASLDRTLKVWDVRYPEAHMYGEYESRLSVSAASWNTAGQIVCNGYDDTINVFDLDSAKWDKKTADLELKPTVRLKHNCQTGRWVSILKARWQERPADGVQKFLIGNMKRYIDIYTGSGQMVAHLDSEDLSAVPAVVQFHRTQNWVVGGTASGKVYLFS